MQYHVLPEFMRQREQRVGGLLTPFQILAGLGGLFPLLVAAQVSLLCLPPVLVLVGLWVYAFSPAEGVVRGLIWLFRLRAFLNSRVIPPLATFADDTGDQTGVPLELYNADGEIALSASVPIEEAI